MSLTLSDFVEWQVQPPQWMNVDWFTHVLNSIFSKSNEKIVVVSVDLQPTKQGFHFTSMVFRANIKYLRATTQSEVHALQLIVKALVEENFVRFDDALLKDSEVFETEIGMYTEVLPKIDEIFAKVNWNIKFAASCLHHSLEPKKFIILQDLKCEGFVPSRGFRDLSYETTLMVYEKLAKFHAATFKIAKEDPSFLAKYRDGYLMIPVVRPMDFKVDLQNFVKGLKFAVNTERLQHFVPLVERKCDHLLTKCFESFKEYASDRQPNSLYVLCHGYLHCEHVMLHGQDDVRLIDFAMSHMGPAALDLIYMKYKLCSRDIRNHNGDELLKKYYECFVETVKRIDCVAEHELPSFDDLKEDIKRHKHWELFAVFVLLESNEDGRADFQKYHDDLADILTRFEEDGYFDE